ncbi:glycine betaine transporter [Gracilibacillus halophilus YIM-C55.5]|uniref:Glycine betaine transporter n=1 Tax=Gracilibacillus halophilus YIM-C55.5 TaxID=1308866 RepID=N4WAB8_9BACI|nr:glycine betaine transporter [Gracilibacillus halophilus YIM-C55.5]
MKQRYIVLYISIFLLSILVLTGVIIPELLEKVTANIKSLFANAFGWYYLILVAVVVISCLYLLMSPVGRIKLGKQDEGPEFSRPTWIAMLFSAGMGIGLVFYGTSEPISHYAISSPTGEIGTDQAIKDALRFTFFHWGIHAWSIYSIVALAIAYFHFRHDHLNLISATLQPLFGDRVTGMTGKAIDTFSVLATVLGVATSLGFGAVQINGASPI